MAEDDAGDESSEEETGADGEQVIHAAEADAIETVVSIPVRPVVLGAVGVVVILGIVWAGIALFDDAADLPEQTEDTDLVPDTDQDADDAEPAAAPPDPDALVQAIHDRVNEIRQREGVGTLQFDEQLAAISENHSSDMASNEYVSPVSRDGEKYSHRYAAAGYDCRIQSEFIVHDGAANVAKTGVPDSPDLSANERSFLVAKRVVDTWLRGSGYRDNLLAPYWENEGIGVSLTQNNTLYVAQHFC